jgi:hypothetical protein
MELQNFTVEFVPLAKAPKGTFAVSYELSAISSVIAIQMGEIELSREGMKRNWFKSKPNVTALPGSGSETSGLSPDLVVVDDVVATPAKEEAPKTEPVDPVKLKFDFDLAALNEKIEAIPPGEMLVINDLDNELYHASHGISCSKLKLFRQCPAKYKAQYIDKIMPEVSKDTFNLGTAIHTITLEPHLFSNSVVRMSDKIKQRRGEKWENFKAANPGKIILPGPQYDLCDMANKAINAHPFARRMVAGGRPEVSIFKRDIETGLIIKCRPDYMLDDLIVDVKTAASAEPKKFGMDAKKFGYHMQDSMYRDISESPEFAFLVIENKAPCIVTAPVLMSPEARRLGYLQYRDALHRLKRAMETDVWENYTNETVVVELTSWENQELETLENGVAA